MGQRAMDSISGGKCPSSSSMPLQEFSFTCAGIIYSPGLACATRLIQTASELRVDLVARCSERSQKSSTRERERKGREGIQPAWWDSWGGGVGGVVEGPLAPGVSERLPVRARRSCLGPVFSLRPSFTSLSTSLYDRAVVAQAGAPGACLGGGRHGAPETAPQESRTATAALPAAPHADAEGGSVQRGSQSRKILLCVPVPVPMRSDAQPIYHSNCSHLIHPVPVIVVNADRCYVNGRGEWQCTSFCWGIEMPEPCRLTEAIADHNASACPFGCDSAAVLGSAASCHSAPLLSVETADPRPTPQRSASLLAAPRASGRNRCPPMVPSKQAQPKIHTHSKYVPVLALPQTDRTSSAVFHHLDGLAAAQTLPLRSWPDNDVQSKPSLPVTHGRDVCASAGRCGSPSMEVETAALGVSFESHVRRPSTANVGDHSWIHPRRRNFLATSRDDLKDQTDRCVQEALSLTPHAQIGLPTSKSQVHTLPSDALCMPLDFFPMHSTPSEGRAAAQLEKRPPESRKSGEMVGEVSLCATHAPQLRENQTQATSGSSISGQCENALEDQSFGLSGIETEDDAYDLGDTRGSACKKAHRGWSPSSNKGSSDDYNLSDLLAAAEDNKSSVLGQSTAREQDQSDPRPAIPPDAIAPSAPAIAQRREVCLRSSVLVPMPCLAEKMCGRSVTACSDVSSMEVNLSVEAVCARLRLPAEVAIICRSELRISRLHDWQASCLALPGVGDGHSLVFSSPTSGGKSLVAELLLARMLVRKSGKAIVILPFVSLVEEVAERLSRLLSPIVSKAFTAGVGRKRRRARPVKVEACHGSRHSVGFDACDVAVCTIEKAHVIINRLVMEGRLAELKMVVVDEVHMLSDPSRGYLLELVLSKLRFVDVHAATRASMLHGARPRGAMLNEDEVDAGNNQRAVAVRAHLDHPIEYEPPRQLVLMSATLTNGRELAIWLGAVFFEANWRPVTLQQYVKFGDRLARFDSTCCALRWDSSHEDVRVLSPLTDDDPSHLAMLCAEITHGVASSAVASGAQATSSIIPIARAPITSGDVLVFCPTKKAAEGAAMHLARSYAVAALGAPDEVLEQRSRLLAHLARLAPAMSGQTPWLDVLRTTLPHGVAFHHAGLSIEARELIEAGFRRPATICILCCTSTLAAGVNLPCQRVLITTCLWYGASNIRGRRALSAGASPSAWLTDPASSMEKSFITPASHRQMSGRAGRMGLAERGDAILFVNSSAEAASAEAMLRAPPDPVRSRMVAGAPEVVRRFALETVACGQANDSDKLLRALRCTMAYAQLASAAEVEALTASLKTELMYLVKLRFLEHDASTRAWAPTPLGRAVYTSGLHPDEAAALHEALQGALARFRCADDLHLVLQLTPPRQVEEAFASEERWER